MGAKVPIMEEEPWYRRWLRRLKVRLGLVPPIEFKSMSFPVVRNADFPSINEVLEDNSMKRRDDE